jgi:putative ABC transport system permease protein
VAGIKALMLISPKDLVSLQSVGLNMTVLLWTLGVSMLTGIIFGLAPALHISRLNLNDSLKDGGKSESARRVAVVDCAAPRRSENRARSVLLASAVC